MILPAGFRRRSVFHALALAPVLALPTLRRAAAGQPPLRIGGTGAAETTIRMLAERHRRAVPDFDFEILSGIGSAGGIAALQAGRLDLALAARRPNEREVAAGNGLRAISYCRTPLAFVIRPELAIERVTSAEVAAIYRGDPARWPDGTPIRLVRRPANDAEFILLAGLSPEMPSALEAARLRPGLRTAATDVQNAEALERLPGSFGTMALGQLVSEGRRLRPLELDGVAPSMRTLVERRYPMARLMVAVTRAAGAPALDGFLGFLRSEEARALLIATEHEPLHDEEAAA